jgi:hypothetical protein
MQQFSRERRSILLTWLGACVMLLRLTYVEWRFIQHAKRCWCCVVHVQRKLRMARALLAAMEGQCMTKALAVSGSSGSACCAYVCYLLLFESFLVFLLTSEHLASSRLSQCAKDGAAM